MKKTYVTTMPDHVGAFLKASRCIAALGVNITRVSYNKAVDIHTLFIEAEGTPEQLDQADAQLKEIGYLQSSDSMQSIVLLEFRLPDVPGSVSAVLELIAQFKFNISYLSSQENGSKYQLFKMGLFVENRADVQRFLAMAEAICDVRVIDYNHSEKNYDNSIFYNSYATGLAEGMGLPDDARKELMINVNLAMQVLDDRGLSPYRTFDSISRFAEMLSRHRAAAFAPRITHHAVTERTEIILIEPPCGSNIAIIHSEDQYLFVDTGYACYGEEMRAIFCRLIPDFDTMPKHALITHADVDHCGLLPMFDRVYMSERSCECIRREYAGEDGFREQNPLHKPYIRICKVLTGYRPMNPEKIHIAWPASRRQTQPIQQVGYYEFGELHFEVFEGMGGHLPGEVILIDYEHKIAFTGDVYVNLKGMTAEQAMYNQYAPILMTSVDTDPTLCAQERSAILQRLGVGSWQIFGAHGMKKDYDVHI